MEEGAKMEKDMSSAAAFVEGGIQDACDDACSICLEEFCQRDPSTVSDCKHEFHLQCILEWCQRSSQCPMCWQSISLKDPASQELLDAVVRERNIRLNQTRRTTIFHHSTFGDFELQHLPGSGSDAEFEERLMQHLAAAATMGRLHHISRRGGHRGSSGSHRQPQFLIFSPHPNASYVGYQSSSSEREENEPTVSTEETHTTPTQTEQNDAIASEISPNHSRPSTAVSQSVPVLQDRPGPSDFQSFSESLRSRLSAVSMRYKESITKSTRGWKERLFSRNSSVANLTSEFRRKPNTQIDTGTHMVDHLETMDNNPSAFTLHDVVVNSAAISNNEGVTGNHVASLPTDSTSSAPCHPASNAN
ncbi:E3 ubiquitin-protein ligase RHF2A-like [Zingiber officinale]|uniref:RING-type E3 ubiquitin transferase n=1 Tax=Zingiber officinale TaxID=94328 RepID=A0A8J5GTG4_ZINOF|nr:E3 ubiquitin-protein ligase RHF2A-like [Zingiber officinale]XP_042377076.1 E3 ubiquitin-protein ligase RHF2A-like [Zingiber officinale]KAG6514732.1 hypothetical protein ZIOFF_025102 [Zingiber officinale]